MITFEDYLEEQFEKNCSDGILDDEMLEEFDNWLSNLDGEEFIHYGQLYGYACTSDTLKTASEMVKTILK